MTSRTMLAGTPATEFPACRVQGEQSVSIIRIAVLPCCLAICM